MQLLDSLQNQLSDIASAQLQSSLEDIVNQIQIESNFCIRHRDYKPVELSPEAEERFHKLPLDLQKKYLSSQLQSFLYGIYYNGSLKETLALDADSEDQALHQNLENNTFLGVDLGFYERLHESNKGEAALLLVGRY